MAVSLRYIEEDKHTKKAKRCIRTLYQNYSTELWKARHDHVVGTFPKDASEHCGELVAHPELAIGCLLQRENPVVSSVLI